jgi:iron-sulfur cluster repair protein YtfE (RIC family)
MATLMVAIEERSAMTHSSTLPTTEQELAAMTIRDLVEIEPQAMEILAPYGIDLCCGGAHPVGEALDLHGIARAEVMPRLVDLAARVRS